MKKLFFSVLLLITLFYGKDLYAQSVIVSPHYALPDNDKQHFTDVNFRLRLKGATPATIAIQFINHGYEARKFKFAIKDVTSKKMILLDTAHNSFYGSEMLKPISESKIWSGPVDDIKDSFSLHIWDSDGNEFDTAPITLSDQ